VHSPGRIRPLCRTPLLRDLSARGTSQGRGCTPERWRPGRPGSVRGRPGSVRSTPSGLPSTAAGVHGWTDLAPPSAATRSEEGRDSGDRPAGEGRGRQAPGSGVGGSTCRRGQVPTAVGKRRGRQAPTVGKRRRNGSVSTLVVDHSRVLSTEPPGRPKHAAGDRRRSHYRSWGD
jgi:hypothetical protein